MEQLEQKSKPIRNTIERIGKSRAYCFTLNNYTEDDIKNIQTFRCEYTFQEETGENGTPHLQGMLYFKNPISFKSIKTLLPRAHIEICKNKIASMQYCSKEDTRTGNLYTNMDFAKIGTKNGTGTAKKIIKHWTEKLPREMTSDEYHLFINLQIEESMNEELDIWNKFEKYNCPFGETEKK